MSAVDVIRVMDSAAIELQADSITKSLVLLDARDAVAELMEAGISYKRARGVKPQHVVNAKFARLEAALTRCGGAA